MIRETITVTKYCCLTCKNSSNGVSDIFSVQCRKIAPEPEFASNGWNSWVKETSVDLWMVCPFWEAKDSGNDTD